MPYQYKREPLSDDEVNRLTNVCGIIELALLDLRVVFGGYFFNECYANRSLCQHFQPIILNF